MALPDGARRDEGINLWKLLMRACFFFFAQGKQRWTVSEFIWLCPTDSVTDILPLLYNPNLTLKPTGYIIGLAEWFHWTTHPADTCTLRFDSFH
jgi:hypothetical protein